MNETVKIVVKGSLKAGEWYDSRTWTASKEDFDFEYYVEIPKSAIREFYKNGVLRFESTDSVFFWNSAISHDVVFDGSPVSKYKIIELLESGPPRNIEYILNECLISRIINHVENNLSEYKQN